MTIVFSGLFLTVVITVAGLVGMVADASADRMRAQIAADAGALAAAAEVGPFGDGKPNYQAARYTRANGARLVRCWCVPGVPAVQVRVAVGDIVADARAEFDAAAITQQPTGSISGLHPRMARAVRALIEAADGRVTVTSGHRSIADQAALWSDALARYGTAEKADNWVAPPGSSMHERGLAVDLGGDLGAAVRLIQRLRLPLVRPLSHEPWHFELARVPRG